MLCTDNDFCKLVDRDATCTENGLKSIHCKNCDETKDEQEIAAPGHDFKWVIDREATETEPGEKHEECKVCGFKNAAVEIPTTGKSAARKDDVSGSD